MAVSVPVFAGQLAPNVGVQTLREFFADFYQGPIVRFCEEPDEGGFFSAAALSGKDSMQVGVFGNDARILLCARYDNLGKGASGAAIACMNLSMGADPVTGLLL